MQVQKHPSTRGLTWLVAGLGILRQQTVALLLIVFIQIMVMLLPLVALPMVGPVISVALIPILYLGLMTAIRAAERGETPNPMMLFSAFEAGNGQVWKPLMILGLISGSLSMVAYGLANYLFPMPDTSGITEQLSAEESMSLLSAKLLPTVIATAITIPVQMAFWYAPMLIAWHGQTIGKAVFFSWMAVWRNFGAFAMLFIGWLGVILLINTALVIVVSLLGIQTSLLTVLIAPTLLFIFTGAYCSFWVTYRDVFTGE